MWVKISSVIENLDPRLRTTHTSCVKNSAKFINAISPTTNNIKTILTLHKNARSIVSPTSVDMPVLW